jgi:hypothetical protein
MLAGIFLRVPRVPDGLLKASAIQGSVLATFINEKLTDEHTTNWPTFEEAA